MSVLPIVERELRVAARRRGAYLTRVTAAGLAVGWGALQWWLESDWSAPAGQGRDIFETLVFLGFGLCLLAGPALTADSLSGEKRAGTLGLLYLTNLCSLDVVLGKLAAASVTALGSLLAIVPVLAVCVLLGGVSGAEIARAALVLANALWFSLAAGMVVSAVCREYRSALALTVFVLFLAVMAPLGLEGGQPNAGAGAGSLVGLFSPVGAFRRMEPADYNRAPEWFWGALAGTHALGWAGLAGAAWLAGRAWRETFAGWLPGRWLERGRRGWGDKSEERWRARARQLDRNPLLWLGARHRWKRRVLWAAVAGALAVWVGFRLSTPGLIWSPGTILLVAFFFQLTLKWLAASEAAYRFAEDRRSGALELLLTTGLSESDIVRGHGLALRRLFTAPVVAVGIVEVMLLTTSGGAGPGRDEWVLAGVTLAVFVWDLPVLALTSMWYSLAGRRPHLAWLRALGRVLVAPWLVFLATLFMVGVWNWTVVAGLWWVVCAASNLLAARAARSGLRTRFREAAAGLWPPTPRPQELALV